MSLSTSLKKVNKPARKEPLWKGPCGEGPNGGVTQSLLSRYLSCKERFRILVVEGLKPTERFNAALDFGNMWHACEEQLAKDPKVDPLSSLCAYEADLGRKFPLQRQEIAEWAGKCAALFPRYVEHWAQHPDVVDRTPLLQEAKFDVPYALPSGRAVRLRGKFDSVDVIGEDGIYLQENKTKGTIETEKINRQLDFDLQTMLYLIALGVSRKYKLHEKSGVYRCTEIGGKAVKMEDAGVPKGVRYNVVRRAKHKTVTSMLQTFGVDQRNGRIGEWFARWRVEVSAQDVNKFKRECLDPILENLCDDFEWWAFAKQRGVSPFAVKERMDAFRDHYPRHFRMPYCGYNPLAEGGTGDVDEYMATGSTVGLVRVENLFPELE